MNKISQFWPFIISLIFLSLSLFWVWQIRPTASALPDNFRFDANVFSLDNFYDESNGDFSGQIESKTDFAYKVKDIKNGYFIIQNLFTVRKPSGEKIFSVERNYGIDPKTGTHVAGLGDHDRNGYLFAPKNLNKQDFTYWHVNYDTPARMVFAGEEEIMGLGVYRYEADYHADQTENLGFLPGVGKTRGIELDINLNLWIEPKTGRMVKYEDKTIAYYYDLKTKERINPWNKFSNKFKEESIKNQVGQIRFLKLKIFVFEWVIPTFGVLISLITLVFSVKQSKYKKKGGEI